MKIKQTPARGNRLVPIVAAALAALPLLSSTSKASDHIDSPTTAQDRGSDIADLYAFVDPNDNSQVVLIASTQGFIVSGEHFGMVIFDHNIRYRFAIENTGDAMADLFLDVDYSPGLGRLTTQTARVTLKDAQGNRRLIFTAPTTLSTQRPQPAPAPEPVVTTDPVSGARFFGGNADDPFFLDDTGANRLVASSFAHPGNPDKSLLGFRRGRDTYAGFNTMITAVRLPAALLRGRDSQMIGVNFVTQRRMNQVIADGAVTGRGAYVNVDRQGNPGVTNFLIPPPLKNQYNGAKTADDAAGRFAADLTEDLQNFGTDAAHINAILDVIQRNGDILRLDLTVPNSGPQGGTNPGGGFGNFGGRRLVDDVVDATFTLFNNGNLLTDFVDANEKRFRDQFPFVADPTQPFPPGDEVDDHTRQ
ncbi:MAG: DUF4331 family protein [Chthoniobacterales bacterium]|nr:DUF4331 family protein [Chthoniobacterales bacterium]